MEKKNEQAKGSQGGRITNLNKVVKTGFPEEVEFGQRFEEGDGVDVWQRASQAEAATKQTCYKCLLRCTRG